MCLMITMTGISAMLYIKLKIIQEKKEPDVWFTQRKNIYAAMNIGFLICFVASLVYPVLNNKFLSLKNRNYP